VPDELLVSTLRVELNIECQRLREQIAELDVTESTHSYDENFADSGQVAAEHGENTALLNKLRAQLTDAERAITKMDDGTYGLCEKCGQPIADARLEVMPATRFCINHA
jgi:DnaK suppressor protein